MTDTTARSNTILTFLTGTSTANTTTTFAHLKTPAHGWYSSDAIGAFNVRDPIDSFQVSGPVAPWLGAVERRLNASIAITGSAEENDGTALNKDVVTAANAFFAATSSMLPSEPYLYGLPTGELVAEFEAQKGRMTIVISSDTATAMSVVDGETLHREIALQAATPDDLQSNLSAIMDRLGTDKHGSMDTQR
jgi:hypothetical protein